MLIAHLTVLIVVFFLMRSIVNMIPGLLEAYRQHYAIDLSRTTRELDKFFLKVKPAKIIIGTALIGGAVGILARSGVVALTIAIAGVFLPKILLAIWKDIRSARFEAQLMDALILMENTLKSGLDIAAGVERVATSLKPPISEEFGLVLNAYRLGTPLEAALMEMTTRINSRTLETVAYAITIQRETGGNLVKTFDQLVQTIREESKLQKKVRAITSQGRTQIFFLAVFPWALAALFYFMAPEFMKPALANSWGQLVIVFLVVWEVIGILVTKKIVTVDV